MKCPTIIIKEASTAMVRAFRRGAINLGDVSSAAKKLKLKSRYLATLGSGAEGTAYLMSHPKAGTAVMKHFDPKGSLFSKKMIEEKIKVLKRMGGKKYTKYYGRGPVDNSLMLEYIEPGQGTQHIMGGGSILKNKFSDFIKTRGSIIEDAYINPGNIIRDPQGNLRVIDFVTRKGLSTTPLTLAAKQLRKDIIKNIGKGIAGDNPKQWLRHPVKHFKKTPKRIVNKVKDGMKKSDFMEVLFSGDAEGLPGHNFKLDSL